MSLWAFPGNLKKKWMPSSLVKACQISLNAPTSLPIFISIQYAHFTLVFLHLYFPGRRQVKITYKEVPRTPPIFSPSDYPYKNSGVFSCLCCLVALICPQPQVTMPHYTSTSGQEVEPVLDGRDQPLNYQLWRIPPFIVRALLTIFWLPRLIIEKLR